jgi:hypothetical protein
MDPNTSALGGRRIGDPTAEFSRGRRAEISLGVAALAQPDKIYSVGNVPAISGINSVRISGPDQPFEQ